MWGRREFLSCADRRPSLHHVQLVVVGMLLGRHNVARCRARHRGYATDTGNDSRNTNTPILVTKTGTAFGDGIGNRFQFSKTEPILAQKREPNLVPKTGTDVTEHWPRPSCSVLGSEFWDQIWFRKRDQIWFQNAEPFLVTILT